MVTCEQLILSHVVNDLRQIKTNYIKFKGGVPSIFFGNINFEIEVAQQGLYMYQNFGEVSGLRRPTGSEPRLALIGAPGIWLF